MKKKGLLALLLTLVMVFANVTAVFAEGGVGAPQWDAADFTYGTETFELYPASEEGKKLTVDAWVITGLSTIGEEKFALNTDLVIPAADPDGKKVQGVGTKAFYKKAITSLELPENVKAAYDDSTWATTGKGLTTRGDFFIAANAFYGTSITTLELPEGVVFVGNNAFKGSKSLTAVQFPKSIMQVWNGSFAQCAITKLDFPDATDFAFQMDNMTFAINQIKMVKLPANTEKLHKWTFIQNTGMEPITNGTTAENKGGKVYLYMDADEKGAYMDTNSVCHELILGKFWTADDFTYDGTTVTGLSDAGKVKAECVTRIDIPEKNAAGAAIELVQKTADMANNTIGFDGWVSDGTNLRYHDTEGNYAQNEWKTIDNKKYFFDGNGYKVTGWLEDGGNKYYMDKDGVMVTGTVTIEGKSYTFDENGVLQPEKAPEKQPESATTPSTTPKAPNTGDSSMIMFYMAVCMVAFAAVVVLKKRNSCER